MVASRLGKKTRIQSTMEASWVFFSCLVSCCLDWGKLRSGINVGSIQGEALSFWLSKERDSPRRNSKGPIDTLKV